MKHVKFQTIDRIKHVLSKIRPGDISNGAQNSKNKVMQIINKILMNCMRDNHEELFFEIASILKLTSKNWWVSHVYVTKMSLSFVKRLMEEGLYRKTSVNIIGLTVYPEMNEDDFRDVLTYVTESGFSLKNHNFPLDLPDYLIDIIFEYGSPFPGTYWIKNDTSIKRFTEIIDRFDMKNKEYLEACLIEALLSRNIGLADEIFANYTDIIDDAFVERIFKISSNVEISHLLDWLFTKIKRSTSTIIDSLNSIDRNEISPVVVRWITEKIPNINLNLSLETVIKSSSVILLNKYLKRGDVKEDKLPRNFSITNEEFLDSLISFELERIDYRIDIDSDRPLNEDAIASMLKSSIKLKRKDLFNKLLLKVREFNPDYKIKFDKRIGRKKDTLKIFVEEDLIDTEIIVNGGISEDNRQIFYENDCQAFYEVYKDRSPEEQLEFIEKLKTGGMKIALYRISLGKTEFCKEAVNRAIKEIMRLEKDNSIVLTRKLDLI